MISCYWFFVCCISFFYIRSARMLKNSINTTTKILILYYYVYCLISHYLPCDIKITLTHVINKMVLFYRTLLFYLRSTISNIYNLHQNLSLAYQTICDHMFLDPKSDHNFHVFLVTYFAYRYFLLVCGNFLLTSNEGSCWNPL